MWDMNKFKKISLLTAQFCAVFALFAAPAVPAFAQEEAQQQINAGLCTGSNDRQPFVSGSGHRGRDYDNLRWPTLHY
jgi:hypothetical protein